MATSMKDLVGDPLDEFAKRFTHEFVKLGIRRTLHLEGYLSCCLVPSLDEDQHVCAHRHC